MNWSLEDLDAVLPWHAWDAAAEAVRDVRLCSGGLPLGTFASGDPALLDLFRPQPVSVTAFVDVTTAVILALRARAAGARVIARDDDAAWQAAVMASRERRQITVLSMAEDLPREPGTFERPFALFDAAEVTAGQRRSLPPWWARFVLPRQMTFMTLSTARVADLVLFGQLTHEQAVMVENIWRLPPQASQAFRRLRRWELGVVRPGRHAVVDLAPDDVELQVQASTAGFQDRAERVRRFGGRHAAPDGSAGDVPIEAPDGAGAMHSADEDEAERGRMG